MRDLFCADLTTFWRLSNAEVRAAMGAGETYTVEVPTLPDAVRRRLFEDLTWIHESPDCGRTRREPPKGKEG
jgi:hypothetical protein